jgi:pyruvate/2-oxoglutarate dehydrogenase complex dihydrolipoamide dehydrogenase (E3) component
MTSPTGRPAGDAPPRSQHYDLVIVGAGPAGLTAAELAARLGAKVALIERGALGGASLNTGSVPSKALIRSATLFSHIRETGRLCAAGHPESKADLKRVAERLDRIRARIARYCSIDALRGSGIDVFGGVARFDGPASITVNGARLQFDRALVATGARPQQPDIPGLVDGNYLTSDTIFALDALPDHLAVVGGGPLGCELAQAFCRLGAQVTIIQNDPKFLPREERDAANILSESMARDGVSIYLNTTVVGARADGAAILLHTTNNDINGVVRADRVLVSVGRVPNVDGLGLDAAGVAFDATSGITVDACLRTSNERVYAAGDVCMADKFTPVAERTARIAVNNLLRGTEQRHTDLVIPWCTFCDPEIAHVGMQVWDARAQSIPVKTYSVLMQDVDRAITDGQDTGFVKVHVHEGTDRILGATIVAARASEMINEVCVAMSAGIGLRDLARAVHSYPAQSRAVWMAAMAFEADLETPGAAATVKTRLTRP